MNWDLGRFAAQAVSGILGGMDSPSGRFDMEYFCYPVSFALKDDLEKGNKILLPQSALNRLARMNVTWPMLFEVSNPAADRRTHSGVLEFIAEEGHCYMPYWMMQNLLLKEGDIVRIVNTSLPKGTYVKIRPVTTDFLSISNPRAVLENALRFFATLTVGDNIVIQYNDKNFEIEIVKAKPAPAVSIIETDVEVDFDPPKDYVEPKPKQKAEKTPEAESSETIPAVQSWEVFSGSGVRLDGGKARPVSSPSKAKANKKRPNEDSDVDEPWKKAVPGGVRSSCEEFEELKKQGRLPGMVGKTKTGDVKDTQHILDSARLFSGPGRRL